MTVTTAIKRETKTCDQCSIMLKIGIVIISIPSITQYPLHLCSRCLVNQWDGLTQEEKQKVMVLG